MRGNGAAGQRGSGAGQRLRRIGTSLRRIAGMPDFEGYLEHLRRCHPDRQVPTEREFYEEFVRCRYGDGATRCC